jgi:uncharacterized membrane protein YagU involved in acid resistance
MQSKIKQSVISGITATVAISLLMMLGAAMGMPKMSPPNMLAAMMGMPVAMGWVMHFLIGIIFAAGYVFLFNNWLKKIGNKYLRGAIYGIVAFVIAQIGIPVMESIFGNGNMPAPEGSVALMMIGSIMGHVVFGIVIALLVTPIVPFTKQILK